MILAITESHIIKKFDSYYTITNYETTEVTRLTEENADNFKSELEAIESMTLHEADKQNRLDNLCLEYL